MAGGKGDIPLVAHIDQPLTGQADTEAVGFVFKAFGMCKVATQVPIALTIIVGLMKFHGKPKFHGVVDGWIHFGRIPQVATDPWPCPTGKIAAVKLAGEGTHPRRI